MSPAPTAPSETDVLQAISGLFTAKRSAAALAHYPTLRIQTDNLHASLGSTMLATEDLVRAWSTKLSNDAEVTTEFRSSAAPLFAYRTIAPALVRNVHQTADFLLEETLAAPPVDVDRVAKTTPSFSDFVKLGAAARGFLDALVQAAYQLATFDGRQLNYKFLQSLLSFATVAPPSLHTSIVSPEMQAALNAYVALSGKDRKNSDFTKAAHDQFPQRLLAASQPVGLPDWRHRNLELLFSFCSDFVHSGYVSVLALGEPGLEVILGGPDDAFTPRAENFAELKQRLLAECAGAYADLLLPVLKLAIARTLSGGLPGDWTETLDGSAREIGSVRNILHRQLVEPVREGLIGSKNELIISCMCGGQVSLAPPHHEWDRFCPLCGSRFVLHEFPAAADYVVSATEVGDVLGGDAVRIADLSDVARNKLKRIAAKHASKDGEGEVSFLLITDLEGCNEDTLKVPSRVTSAPQESQKGQCTLFAFVAAKSLVRCTAARIECNCGAEADYQTDTWTNVCQCPRCRTYIGLLGVTGGGTSIQTRNPDGTPGTAPVQARDRFAVPGIAVG